MRVVVIGAGVAGLSAAREVRALRPDAELHVLEASDRPGGLVDTERTPEGFLLEHGPDSVGTQKPAGLAVVRDLGLEGEVVGSDEGPRSSFMVHQGRLVPLPTGMIAMSPSAAWSVMRSPLFSVKGKARIAMEPFVPSRVTGEDESIGGFFRRRFGDEMVDRMLDPVLRGIYGAPIDELSLGVTMPRLALLERKYGSVAAGMAKVSRMRRSGEAPPPLFTLRGGMGALTDRLAAELNGRVRYGAAVSSLTRGQGGWRVRLEDGGELEADRVIVAAPAWAAARMIEAPDPELAALLGDVSHGPMVSVSLGFRAVDVPHPMEGTGFVVPANVDRSISACTWSSRKWPGRAPEGTALIRAFVRDATLSDAEAIDAMRVDLRDLMGIEAEPVFTRVRRRGRALPRCGVGHLDRVARMEERGAELGGLALAGNSQRGVGIPDCIESGAAAAARLLG